MGYEQSNTARLLFIHTSCFPIAPAPRRRPGVAQAFWQVLTLRRRPPDHDKIHRAARLFIVEHANGQPSGPPCKRIQVGAALIEQGAVRAIVMAMDDVELAEALGKSLRIALPQQRVRILSVERNFGVNASVNVKAMRIEMRQLQSVE